MLVWFFYSISIEIIEKLQQQKFGSIENSKFFLFILDFFCGNFGIFSMLQKKWHFEEKFVIKGWSPEWDQ